MFKFFKNRDIQNELFIRMFPEWACFPLYYLFRRKGFVIYRKYLKKYGPNVKLLICPYPGTGDVYLAAGFALNLELDDNAVFIVIGYSNRKILELYGIKNIEVIDDKDLFYLIRYLAFMEMLDRMLILHPSAPQLHYGINDMLRNYSELNFMDMYRYGVFRGMVHKFSLPTFKTGSAVLEEYVKRGVVRQNKTVLLAPYSYTLSVFPEWFWIKLAKMLKERGYEVLTNCGNDRERPIVGTLGVFLPYEQLKVFLEYCGTFIGVRSGFCEIVSSINCKKIVLYQPYVFWGEGTIIDYFSLKKMKICNNAVEMEYEGIEFGKMIDQIVGLFD